MLEARDGALELVEHDVTDGWVVDVVSEAPDELRLVLTPAPNASGASTRAVHDTTTTVVVRLTPTGIETYTESRATSGEG